MKTFMILAASLPALTLAMPLSLSSIGTNLNSATITLTTRQTPALNTATDNLLFGMSLSSFISNRNAQNPAGLDWSSDGCSYSPDNPFGFKFLPACYRHDFGYRNYKKQNRFSDANKLRIDNNFKSDMYNQCAGEANKGACQDTANLYYDAVRNFGKREVGEEMEK